METRKRYDIKAHIDDATKHPRNVSGGGTLPTGTENQTIRKSATAWESTSILKVHADGAEITVDHPLDETTPRLLMCIPVELGHAGPSAVGKPNGTMRFFYIP